MLFINVGFIVRSYVRENTLGITMKLRIHVLLLTMLSQVVVADEHQDATPVIEDTPEAACDILKSTIAATYLPSGKPHQSWFCDFSDQSNGYLYFIALRSNQQRGNVGDIYSTLIGWFAVARRSTLVLQWDVGEDRLVSVSPSYAQAKKDEVEERRGREKRK